MKHIKIFKNWINESIEGLTKEVIDKDLQNFKKENPEKLATEEILPCGAIMKTNDYSGVKTIETKFMYLRAPVSVGGSVTTRISKAGDGPKLGNIYIWFSTQHSYIDISRGEIFYIKFDDNTIIKIPTNGSVGSWDSTSNLWDHSTGFYPNPDQLNILQTKEITGFKYYLMEKPITGKSALKFIEALKCVNNA